MITPTELREAYSNGLQQVFAAIGSLLVAGGGAAAVGYLIFRSLGQKWLDTKFEERLATYKHAQQREIERLKFHINALMDRTTKLHQREFDVLPEAWSLLVDAHHSVLFFVSGMRSYPDFDRISHEQLDEWLATTPLTKVQCANLREATDQSEYYRKTIYWHEKHECHTVCLTFSRYILKNGIFIPPETKRMFKQLEDAMWEIKTKKELREEYPSLPPDRGATPDYSSLSKRVMDELEAKIAGRLWSAEQMSDALER